MVSAHATHPGLLRQNNEDYIRTDDHIGVYLLADGIGGHNAGEVASALAVETIYSILRSNITHTAFDQYLELVVHALNAAHWEVYNKACSDVGCAKMGTTLVAAIMRDNKAFVANAGDSRCYLFRNGPDFNAEASATGNVSRLSLLTRDHTVGDFLLARGLSMGQIPRHQFHTLTQSIGCGHPPVPDSTVVEFTEGDLLLLCSDGLTDMLTEAEIERILEHAETCLEPVAEALVDAANAKGGKDNVSVILVTACSDALSRQ